MIFRGAFWWPYFSSHGWHGSVLPALIWLVVTGCHFFYFPINIENNPPNWLSYFSEGWLNHQPVISLEHLHLGLGSAWLRFGSPHHGFAEREPPKRGPVSMAATARNAENAEGRCKTRGPVGWNLARRCKCSEWLMMVHIWFIYGLYMVDELIMVIKWISNHGGTLLVEWTGFFLCVSEYQPFVA